MKKFGLPTVVAINRFPTDSEQELDWLLKHCQSRGARAAISEDCFKGRRRGVELAEEVLAACEEPNHFQPSIPWICPLRRSWRFWPGRSTGQRRWNTLKPRKSSWPAGKIWEETNFLCVWPKPSILSQTIPSSLERQLAGPSLSGRCGQLSVQALSSL